MFEVDPAFLETSWPLGELALSHVRLQADARFPWLILVPRLPGVRELEDLAAGERDVLMEEIIRAGAAVRAIGEAFRRPVEKLNVGQLGNVTPQLHVHIVGRRADDMAWPGPVWGSGEPRPHADQGRDAAIAAARTSLGF